MQKTPYEHPFVNHLLEHVANDRAARAALRRTLGRTPGEAPEAFRYVVPWLPNPCSEQVESIYYLVAGLFAYHPKHTSEGNMGAHLRKLAGDDDNAKERIERRLVAVMRAHPHDLPDHLRRLVGILKAKEIPINWHGLMGDLLNWDHEERFAQKHWANSFWGGRSSKETESDASTGNTTQSDNISEEETE
ncbi:MAG: type I-E CRISPR-associated protein Cse2/CasB [Chloroflexi bacterium GWB2_54_36]|nr:MAG: type I-E CRISPR-associated protein Cse2/CasB [Chloroflexi bacterium GWB2_54_36]